MSETRLFSSEVMRRSGTVRVSGSVASGEADAAATGRRLDADRRGHRKWSVVALSVLSSAVFVAAVGCFCALVYPIMKELRAERVRGVDGTEERILGFWSILVLSVLVGSICCVLSWTLTYLDSYQAGSLALSLFRDASDQGFLMDYGVVVLNGIMAMLTVIWSLT
ncbi:ADP-ribosylation factor 6-interacting 6 [Solea senegalensis]|uniref:ADP-ribosylation factor 6-interacting 6 n=2 Tax=Solea senegalensis TaxID=28829 RepID=A0AAV6RA31_SOLSE|nr:ADP-ribosylation factor-like protein 6-interacting protein 6 isoform X1 [Solea senegalensis]KAG7502238.1 ADP-ribosylation factor 6-interacting 6 [Solea senegalensis]